MIAFVILVYYALPAMLVLGALACIARILVRTGRRELAGGPLAALAVFVALSVLWYALAGAELRAEWVHANQGPRFVLVGPPKALARGYLRVVLDPDRPRRDDARRGYVFRLTLASTGDARTIVPRDVSIEGEPRIVAATIGGRRIELVTCAIAQGPVTAFAFAPPGRCPTVPDDWWADLEPRSRARPGP
ncbi:MAG: hypothetical protein U0230_01030 [Polyangiales bacterium]